MFRVYILQSLKDHKTYVGYTKDLAKRLIQHNSGQVLSTRCRKPLKLLFSEELQTALDAKRREKWWKSSGGRRKLKEFFVKNNHQ